jgi:hypothetical protein
MTIAFVQAINASSSAASTIPKTWVSAGNTAGNCLVVLVFWNDATTATPTCTDSFNTYTQVGSTFRASSFGSSGCMFVAANCAGCSANTNTLTITWGSSVNFPSVFSGEYSGVAHSSPGYNLTGLDGNSASPAVVSIAPTTSGDMLIGGAYVNNDDVTGAASGCNQRAIDGAAESNLVDRLTVSTSSVAIGATFTSATEAYLALAAAFAQPGSGSPVAGVRLGTFDLTAYPLTWWDATAVSAGWYSDENVPNPPFIPSSFPYSTARLTPQIAQYFAIPTAPERKSPLAAPGFPDRVVRLETDRRQSWTGSPAPEGALPLDWAPDRYPDSLPRRAFEAFSQEFTAGGKPERTAPLADAHYPAMARATTAPVSAMQAAAFVPLVTSSVFLNWSTSYPDSARQPASVAASSIAAPTAPERTSPQAATSYPDAIKGPALTVASVPSAVLPVAPERTSPLAWTSYPDALPRPLMPASWAVIPSAPEGTLSLDWQPAYPDRATGLSLARAALPFEAFAPAPERTTALASTVFPDATTRPFLARASTPAWTAPTTLERPSPLAWPFWPDATSRPTLAPPSQLAVTELPPRPERTSTLAWAFWPDRVDRPAYATHEQAFVTGLSPLPIANVAAPLGVGAWWPDSTWSRSLPPGALQSLALGPSPLPDTPLRWRTLWPDATSAPALSAANRQAFASEVQPERVTSLAATSYPDSLPRPALPPTWVAMPVTLESAGPLASSVYPDRVVRQPPELRQAWASSATPERTLPLASVSFPDSIVRLAPQEQQHSAIWPLPIVSLVTGWGPTFADSVRALAQPAYEQPTTACAIAPERTSPVAWVAYPDATARQPITPSWVTTPTTTAPPTAWTSYPDATTRPALQTGPHQTSSFNPLPRIPVTTWLPCYPDSTRRPRLPAFEQMASALGRPTAPTPLCLHLSDRPLLTLTLSDTPLFIVSPGDTPLLRVRVVDAPLLSLTTANEPLLNAKPGEDDC